MNNNQPIADDLLGKYLARETTEQENALVEDWLKTDEQNKKQLVDYQFIQDRIIELNQEKETKVDIDLAWKKVQKRIQQPTKMVELKPLRKPFFDSYKIAASITFFMVAGLLIYFLKQKTVETISIQTQNNILEKTLPDGSKITLNRNSKLSYSSDFEGETRSVSLVGEAFFDIQRDETKPFIIDAQGTEIKVLGTSFNVKAYTEKVKVSVETGKVSFKKQQKSEILLKGEEAEWISEKDSIAKRIMLDKNTLAYKTHIYIFEDSSLEHILKVLSEGYRVPISLRNSGLKYCRLTTKFDNETLPNTLNIIAETLNLKLTKEGEKYYFDGECK